LLNLSTSKIATRWTNGSSLGVNAVTAPDLLPRPLFLKMVCLERNRAERSGRRLVLMLINSPNLLKYPEQNDAAEKIQEALALSTRETDIKGWYRDGATLGVIFTEIPMAETAVVKTLSSKVNAALHVMLGAQQFSRLTLSFHVFPDACAGDDDEGTGRDDFASLYPDLVHEMKSRRLPLLAKRGLDIAGSLLAILLLGPLMLLIAIAVRMSSPGPVLFRQTRLGESGKGFTFLKFRSMYSNTEHSIHEAYIKRLIANQAGSAGEGSNVYKIQGDPRITRLGGFLRRTSLDELPQFFNVLAGHMSLVGPRPPIPYEFASYHVWHRRRLLAVKPGITGYWQVEGRSRVKFDEMVRMDLHYAREWSLWRDIKILLQTPGAVLGGNGAC
jgi:lipopolysaccharide/colanic/teichoic acid biosynthesis glycosyltransferase